MYNTRYVFIIPATTTTPTATSTTPTLLTKTITKVNFEEVNRVEMTNGGWGREQCPKPIKNSQDDLDIIPDVKE